MVFINILYYNILFMSNNTNPAPPSTGGYLGNFGIKTLINGYSNNRFAGTFTSALGGPSNFTAVNCLGTATFGNLTANIATFATAVISNLMVTSSVTSGTGLIQTVYTSGVVSATTGGFYMGGNLMISNYGTGNLFIGNGAGNTT